MSVERRQRPQPSRDVGRDDEDVKAAYPEAQFADAVVENAVKRAAHFRPGWNRCDV